VLQLMAFSALRSVWCSAVSSRVLLATPPLPSALLLQAAQEAGCIGSLRSALHSGGAHSALLPRAAAGAAVPACRPAASGGHIAALHTAARSTGGLALRAPAGAGVAAHSCPAAACSLQTSASHTAARTARNSARLGAVPAQRPIWDGCSTDVPLRPARRRRARSVRQQQARGLHFLPGLNGDVNKQYHERRLIGCARLAFL